MFGIPFYGWGLAAAAGFSIAAILAMLRARAMGVSTNRIADLLFWGAVTGIPGARIAFLLQHPEHLTGLSTLLDVRLGGMSFYGGVATAAPTLWWLCRRYQLDPGNIADIFAPAVAMGQSIHRLGCFSAGCCYGAVCDFPWAIVANHPQSLAPQGVPLHPTQLYESVGLALLAGLLIVLWSRRKTPGKIFFAYTAGYGLLRIVVETMRGDPDRGWLWEPHISVAQAAALVLILLTALWIRRRVSSEATPPSSDVPTHTSSIR